MTAIFRRRSRAQGPAIEANTAITPLDSPAPPCHWDPDGWFPDGHGSNFPQPVRGAIRACSPCPYRGPCLDAALDYEQGIGPYGRYGIWGGFTPGQRARLAAELRKPGDEND